MRHYIPWEALRSGIDLRLYPGRLIHLKAILTGGRELIRGYVGIEKTYKGKIPLTVCRLTDAGQEAFPRYRARGDVFIKRPRTSRKEAAGLPADPRTKRRR